MVHATPPRIDSYWSCRLASPTTVTTISKARASRIPFFFVRDEALRIDGVALVLAYPSPMLILASDVGDGNDLVCRGITCAHVLPFTYSQFNVGVVQTVSLDFIVTGRTVITGDPTSSVRLPYVTLSGLGLAYPKSRTLNKGVWVDVRDRSIQAPILNVGGAEVEVNDNPREKVEVVIRLDPALAVCNAVVGDLGRVSGCSQLGATHPRAT